MPLETAKFCPVFTNAPVAETVIGVQFAPLQRFRTGHYGLFWQECLGVTDWEIREDVAPINTATESFDSLAMNIATESESDEEEPPVRMRLSTPDRIRSIQFQTNWLLSSWKRDGDRPPSHKDVRKHFDGVFARLETFASKWSLSPVRPNLWEVTYINVIPQGEMWQTPSDWHNIFPTLFSSSKLGANGFEWATFTGEWFLVIPPKKGRIHINAAKMLVNQSKTPSLMVRITARGAVGGNGVQNWAEGVDLGHESVVKVFHDLASPKARENWGMKNEKQ